MDNETSYWVLVNNDKKSYFRSYSKTKSNDAIECT